MRRIFGLRVLALVTMSCAARTQVAPPAAANNQNAPQYPALVSSNILRGDYAGSRACQSCHSDIYDKFMAAPMHNMTRLPNNESVLAPFSGEHFKLKDDDVLFETRGGDRFMTITSRLGPTRVFKITRVIGGHYREDFAGVEVGGGDTGNERIMPASWFLAQHSWRYKGYSVMGPERPGMRPGGIWNKTCIFCHNTIPYFSDMQGAIADARAGVYQGEVVDPLLPPERRARYRVSDDAAYVRAADAELAALGARASTATTATAAAADLVRATRSKLTGANLVELGIGCESCHGGSVEHVKHNATRPSLAPRASFISVDNGGKTAAEVRARDVNRVCARCHQVLFTQYPWTWEGGMRRGANLPGGSNINSGEARDFMLGGCASAMTCVDCHDPHGHNRALAGDIEKRADGVCLRCHDKFAGAEAQRAHTHHDPAGAGGRCLNCHMPKKNMTLDNGLGRYHRVASPTENAKVEGDRPLECALCHGDKTVGALVQTMQTWWRKSFDQTKLSQLYGPDWEHADPLLATLERGKPHEQAVALALLGTRGDKKTAAKILPLLTHPVPIIRYYAANALAAIAGAPLPVDVHGHNDAILAGARAWLVANKIPVGELPRATNATTNSGPGDNEDQ